MPQSIKQVHSEKSLRETLRKSGITNPEDQDMWLMQLPAMQEVWDNEYDSVWDNL